MNVTAAEPGPGVSWTLARERAARIRDLRYDVALSIPESPCSPISARVSAAFALSHDAFPVVFDFEPGSGDGTLRLDVNGRSIDARLVNGHLVIPAAALRSGQNVVTMAVDAGDAPLNRSGDFLYSIFVPARAHESLPCVDQPDLKARWTLALDVPAGWEALGNSAETSRETRGGRTRFVFAETPPISTYLFAFAAGRLSIERATRGKRVFRVLHRETGDDLARNLEAIVALHAASLEWLERYTDIPYPFGKFDLLLVPAFQFSGMEHPGAIFYNASSLLVDASATRTQQLDRAALIAHETAHIWFGDLVTMPWFDDVWVKEVFANVMAGKILTDIFPDVNHDLRFLHAHYPPAFDVDRTDGANPIRQPLDNLQDAGSLYGAIVYHKAPIVMQQLEMKLGSRRFRDGVREYLRRHSFGSASWGDLLAVFDEAPRAGIGRWTGGWVDAAGRSIVETVVEAQAGKIERLALIDTSRRGGPARDQDLRIALVYPDRLTFVPASLDREIVDIEGTRGLPAPLAVLPNGGGTGYAHFRLDPVSVEYFLRDLPDVGDPLVRAAAWLTLWEAMLDGEVAPGRLIDLVLRWLPREADDLNGHRALTDCQHAYWRFTGARRRSAIAARVERTLIDLLHQSPVAALRAACFRTLRDVSLSPSILGWLASIWRRDEQVPGLTLGERDDISLVQELAVRAVPGWHEMLAAQIARISGERRDRLVFVSPALADDAQTRVRFFLSLRDRANRRHEPWVLEAVRYLHHPLRAEAAVGCIRPGLELLREIHSTGDIFFPKRWVEATLFGHQSAAAAREVRAFLDDLPAGYPDRLRSMVVSSADPLFRAVRIVEGSGGTGGPQAPPS